MLIFLYKAVLQVFILYFLILSHLKVLPDQLEDHNLLHFTQYTLHQLSSQFLPPQLSHHFSLPNLNFYFYFCSNPLFLAQTSYHHSNYDALNFKLISHSFWPVFCFKSLSDNLYVSEKLYSAFAKPVFLFSVCHQNILSNFAKDLCFLKL